MPSPGPPAPAPWPPPPLRAVSASGMPPLAPTHLPIPATTAPPWPSVGRQIVRSSPPRATMGRCVYGKSKKEPPLNDYTGQQFGNYRLLRLLDSGGFADVHLGEHIYLHTSNAVKILQIHFFNAEEQQDFLREAQFIAHLHHPHIIQVQDFGLREGIPFLVMSYAPHGNLRQRHHEGTHVPFASVVAYVNQAASALQYAHHRQLIHRDIKPENLLLDEHDELLLSDFGIAIIARSSRSQSLQEVVGTVTYMAPEQIQGRPRPASDQYALAALPCWLSLGALTWGGCRLVRRKLWWHALRSFPPLPRSRPHPHPLLPLPCLSAP